MGHWGFQGPTSQLLCSGEEISGLHDLARSPFSHRLQGEQRWKQELIAISLTSTCQGPQVAAWRTRKVVPDFSIWTSFNERGPILSVLLHYMTECLVQPIPFWHAQTDCMTQIGASWRHKARFSCTALSLHYATSPTREGNSARALPLLGNAPRGSWMRYRHPAGSQLSLPLSFLCFLTSAGSSVPGSPLAAVGRSWEPGSCSFSFAFYEQCWLLRCSASILLLSPPLLLRQEVLACSINMLIPVVQVRKQGHTFHFCLFMSVPVLGSWIWNSKCSYSLILSNAKTQHKHLQTMHILEKFDLNRWPKVSQQS